MSTIKELKEEFNSNISDMLHSNIHPSDIPVVRKYTSISRPLNRALLRGSPLSKVQKDIHEGILNSCRPVGQHIVLYSGTGDINFGDIAKKSRDGIIHSPAHISTTHSMDVASKFAFAVGGKSQMIHIHMRPEDSAVHVSKVSKFPDEHETVIPAGTKLKYVRSEKSNLTGGHYAGKPVMIHHFTIHRD